MAPPPPDKQGLITRQGQRLFRNGAEFRFTGFNIYNANSVGNFWYDLATGGGLGLALAGMGKVELIRAWFGQRLAHPRPGSGLTWRYFDSTLELAQQHGQQVVVVLGEQDGSWDDGVRKTFDSQWYQSGYRTFVSDIRSRWGTVNSMTYRDFALALVARYKDHPAVAFWQLLNEAEIHPVDPARRTPELEDQGAIILRDWANDMAAAIKAIDPHHLISLGSIGTGQFGMSGSRFELVHSGPHIDLLEMHDYDYANDGIGDRYNGLEVRLQQAARLNKPLFVGEVGVRIADVGNRQVRADRFRQKILYQRQRGVVGHLAWAWRNAAAAGDDDGYDITPQDPAVEVFQSL